MSLRRPGHLLLLAFLSVAACEAERDESGQIATAGSVDAFAMRVGDCFDDEAFDSEEISSVPAVPCAEPHDNEVYALFDLPDGPWPGTEEVQDQADQGCLERFEDAIGVPYPESALILTWMIPTEMSWDLRNDREVVCIAFHMDGEELTGSVLGSEM